MPCGGAEAARLRRHGHPLPTPNTNSSPPPRLVCACAAFASLVAAAEDKHGNPPKAYATYHGHTLIKDFLAIKEGEAKKKEGEDGDSGRVCSSCTVQ